MGYNQQLSQSSKEGKKRRQTKRKMLEKCGYLLDRVKHAGVGSTNGKSPQEGKITEIRFFLSNIKEFLGR